MCVQGSQGELSSLVALRRIKMVINMNSAWNKITYYKSRREIKHSPGGLRMKRILMPFCLLHCYAPLIPVLTAENTEWEKERAKQRNQPSRSLVTPGSSARVTPWRRAVWSHTFIMGDERRGEDRAAFICSGLGHWPGWRQGCLETSYRYREIQKQTRDSGGSYSEG